MQVSPGLAEQLLQVLEQFSAAGAQGAPEVLYDGLSCVLRPWPQLLRDFAAFLSREQAGRCGLVSDLTQTTLTSLSPAEGPDRTMGPVAHSK